jgi:drug/metabolite transporter (DMT)-like permease
LIVIAGPLFAAQTGYFVTASGVVFGIIIFGEQHSAWIWIALGVLFAGVALANPRNAENGEATHGE